MSQRVTLSDHAAADMRSIASWIAHTSGTDQSHLRPNLRSVPFGNYLVFFRRTPNGIAVVRVIHAARDYKRFFQ